MVTPLHLPGHGLAADGEQLRKLDAVVSVPTSKSVANRVLVCALLAEGESVISDLPDGDDVSAMRDALIASGRLQSTDGSDPMNATSVRVTGGPSHGPYLPEVVHCRLAGTTSRFLTAVAALQTTDVVITGDEPLRGRPMAPLHNALRELGSVVEGTTDGSHLPVTVRRGVHLNRRVVIDGSMSSQFISALMMIGPCVSDGLVLEVNGTMVSRSYVDMTAQCMRLFGADVQFVGNEIRIAATPYIPASVAIEPDYSSAAFPIAAALIKGGRVRIKSLAKATMQGDQEILDIARDMGAVVGRDGDDVVVIVDSTHRLQPIDRDMSNCSDLVPAVAMACSITPGTSRLRNIGFIRAKESDRMSDLALEFGKFGCRIKVDGNDLVIDGIDTFHSARIDPHHDHRMAMAGSLGCLRGADVLIDDPDVVSKSWPGFFSQMSEILRAS